MELDELKQLWSDFDKKLSEKLIFNEKLLRKMNLNKSWQELHKHLLLELINIGINFPMVVYLTVSCIRLFDEPLFSVPGFIAILLLTYSLFSSIKKINIFSRMDYDGSPIVQFQQELSKLKAAYFRFRKIELILLPILIISMTPIYFKSIAHINVYEKLEAFLFGVGLALVLSYLIAFWHDSNLDKKFKNAEMFLIEIDNFVKEE